MESSLSFQDDEESSALTDDHEYPPEQDTAIHKQEEHASLSTLSSRGKSPFSPAIRNAVVVDSAVSSLSNTQEQQLSLIPCNKVSVVVQVLPGNSNRTCLFPLVGEDGNKSPHDVVVVNPTAFGKFVPAQVTLDTARLVARVANIESEDWARRYTFNQVLWENDSLQNLVKSMANDAALQQQSSVLLGIGSTRVFETNGYLSQQVRALLERLDENAVCTLSIMEIVDSNKLQDLLVADPVQSQSRVSISHSKRHGAVVQNLADQPLDSMTGFHHLLGKVLKQKREGHVIATIKIWQNGLAWNLDNRSKCTTIVVGELATGNNRNGNARRMAYFRKSISGLRGVLRGLLLQESISYRENTLTQVLQHFLTKSKIVVLGSVSASSDMYEESLSILSCVHGLIRPGRTAQSPFSHTGTTTPDSSSSLSASLSRNYAVKAAWLEQEVGDPRQRISKAKARTPPPTRQRIFMDSVTPTKLRLSPSLEEDEEYEPYDYMQVDPGSVIRDDDGKQSSMQMTTATNDDDEKSNEESVGKKVANNGDSPVVADQLGGDYIANGIFREKSPEALPNHKSEVDEWVQAFEAENGLQHEHVVSEDDAILSERSPSSVPVAKAESEYVHADDPSFSGKNSFLSERSPPIDSPTDLRESKLAHAEDPSSLSADDDFLSEQRSSKAVPVENDASKHVEDPSLSAADPFLSEHSPSSVPVDESDHDRADDPSLSADDSFLSRQRSPTSGPVVNDESDHAHAEDPSLSVNDSFLSERSPSSVAVANNETKHAGDPGLSVDDSFSSQRSPPMDSPTDAREGDYEVPFSMNGGEDFADDKDTVLVEESPGKGRVWEGTTAWNVSERSFWSDNGDLVAKELSPSDYRSTTEKKKATTTTEDFALWSEQNDDDGSAISLTSLHHAVSSDVANSSDDNEGNGISTLSKDFQGSVGSQGQETWQSPDQNTSASGNGDEDVPGLSKELDVSGDLDSYIDDYLQGSLTNVSETTDHQKATSSAEHFKPSVEERAKFLSIFGADQSQASSILHTPGSTRDAIHFSDTLSPTDKCLDEIHVLEDAVGQIRKLHNGLWETSAVSLDRLRQSQLLQQRSIDEAVASQRDAESRAEGMRQELVKQSRKHEEICRGYELRIGELESRVKTVVADRSDMEKIAEEAIADQDRLEKEVSRVQSLLRKQEEATERTVASYNDAIEMRNDLETQLETKTRAYNGLESSHRECGVVIADLKATVERLTKENKELRAEKDASEAQATSLSKTVAEQDKLKRLLGQAEEENLTLSTDNARLTGELRDLQAHFVEVEHQKSQQAVQQQSELESLQSDLDMWKRRHKKVTDEAELAARSHETERAALLGELSDTKALLQESNAEVAALEQVKARLVKNEDGKVARMMSEIDALKLEREQDRKALSDKGQAYAKLQSDAKAKLKHLVGQKRDAQTLIQKLQEENSAHVASNKLLRDRVERETTERESLEQRITSLQERLEVEQLARAATEERVMHLETTRSTARDTEFDAQPSRHSGFDLEHYSEAELALLKELDAEKGVGGHRGAESEDRLSPLIRERSGRASSQHLGGGRSELSLRGLLLDERQRVESPGVPLETFRAEQSLRMQAEELAAAISSRAKEGLEKRNKEIATLKRRLSSLADEKEAEVMTLRSQLHALKKELLS